MGAKEPWEVTQAYIRSSNRFVVVVLILSALLMALLVYLKWGQEESYRTPPPQTGIHLPQQR